MSFGYASNATAVYQQNSVRGGVEGADPHQLISMLLGGVIERIAQARGYITHGNVPGKGSSVARALAILGELRGSLDHKADPTLSGRLDSLYEYITRRLLHAQLNDDVAALDEAISLLTPVREGWHGIRASYLADRNALAGAL